MILINDLVRTLHDIDALKGRVCGACAFSIGKRHCMKGYRPAGADDGCDDWQPRQPARAIAHQQPRQAQDGAI